MILLSLLVTSTLAGTPPPPTQQILDQGKKSFETNCVACHGATGEGDGPAGKVLNPHPRNYKKDTFKQGDKVEEIFKTLETGVPGTPMVAWAHLPEAERWALAYYVKDLQKPGQVLKPAEEPKPAKAPKAAPKAAPKKK